MDRWGFEYPIGGHVDPQMRYRGYIYIYIYIYICMYACMCTYTYMHTGLPEASPPPPPLRSPEARSGRVRPRSVLRSATQKTEARFPLRKRDSCLFGSVFSEARFKNFEARFKISEARFRGRFTHASRKNPHVSRGISIYRRALHRRFQGGMRCLGVQVRVICPY
jgi:hypothetical protein